MSPRTNHFTPHNDPYRGESFPIRELADSLGCPGADSYRLESTLKELCRTCAIRFGIPEAARKPIAEWLGLPQKTELTYPTIHQAMDPRWVRLAEALELPRKGDLPLISVALPSQSALHILADAARQLAQDIASLKLKGLDPKLGEQLRTVENLRPDPNAPDFTQYPELLPIALSAFRQARNFLTVGPSFALVTSEEQFFLRGCALRQTETETPPVFPKTPTPSVVEAIDRNNRAVSPPIQALAHLGVVWRWKAERGSWEPALPQSRHHGATLFDESSIYFDKVLRTSTAYMYSPEKREFLQALRNAREEFEMARASGNNNPDALLRKQERIFARALANRRTS